MSKFHSILFRLESKKIIVQRHYTWQPYRYVILIQYSAWTAALLSLRFLGVPLGSLVIIWFLRQRQGRVSDSRGPRV